MNENPPLDLSEKGRKNGQPISLDRRLFMQFLAFGGCLNVQPIQDTLAQSGADAVLYADVNDAQAVGLLTLSENPNFFVDTLRPLLQKTPFVELTPKPEMTMMGRTYTIGYEPDLEEALFNRPRGRVLNPELPWVIWYPLRRSGSFEELSDEEQRKALGEHGGIGKAFGRAGLATDIRLACHGLDKHDNDFVIGLLGKELFPLSAVVQTMRKTIQTKRHIDRLGPFFVGKVLWQSKI
ncbi:MAG: chlorite dismutase family protein [Chloroflexota bacterium]